MIKAVVFDLFETLITESGIRPTRASSLASALGLEEHAYRAEWKKRRPHVVRGDISFTEALTEICETLTGRVDADSIQGFSEQRIREKAAAYAQRDAAVAALVRTLSDRGIRLAVISNGFEEDVIGWSQCSLAPQFQSAVFSFAEHVAKPDAEIYLRAVRRLGVEPAMTAYIGDGGDDELIGAERAGLQAGRAAWFVRDAAHPGPWPELRTAEDVLRFVEAG